MKIQDKDTYMYDAHLGSLEGFILAKTKTNKDKDKDKASENLNNLPCRHSRASTSQLQELQDFTFGF